MIFIINKLKVSRARLPYKTFHGHSESTFDAMIWSHSNSTSLWLCFSIHDFDFLCLLKSDWESQCWLQSSHINAGSVGYLSGCFRLWWIFRSCASLNICLSPQISQGTSFCMGLRFFERLLCLRCSLHCLCGSDLRIFLRHSPLLHCLSIGSALR